MNVVCKFFLIFVLAALFSCSHHYIPQTGDLVFQDLDCGSLCDAIEKVTTGIEGKNFSHIGIITVEKNKAYVLEAIGPGVIKTPFDSFLQRSNKVIAGRVKEPYRPLIPQAIERSLSLLTKPYDDGFDINNQKYYCSELVYYSYLDTLGKPLFQLNPMTFIDPDTRKTFPAWTTYFQSLNMPTPEGQPGLNPGGISRSPVIDIVYRFY